MEGRWIVARQTGRATFRRYDVDAHFTGRIVIVPAEFIDGDADEHAPVAALVADDADEHVQAAPAAAPGATQMDRDTRAGDIAGLWLSPAAPAAGGSATTDIRGPAAPGSAATDIRGPAATTVPAYRGPAAATLAASDAGQLSSPRSTWGCRTSCCRTSGCRTLLTTQTRGARLRTRVARLRTLTPGLCRRAEWLSGREWNPGHFHPRPYGYFFKKIIRFRRCGKI